MNNIIPAVLPKNQGDLEQKLQSLPADVDFFQLDVLEEDLWHETGKGFEAHIMSRDPEAVILKWMERGAKRIIVHSLGPAAENCRGKAELGLGVEMHIPLEEVFALVPRVDFVQFMSIAEIGEQGHPFDGRIFDRIKGFKEKFPHIPVSVDGGINISNYKELLDAGADRLVVGSGFKDLWEEINKK